MNDAIGRRVSEEEEEYVGMMMVNKQEVGQRQHQIHQGCHHHWNNVRISKVMDGFEFLEIDAGSIDWLLLFGLFEIEDGSVSIFGRFGLATR